MVSRVVVCFVAHITLGYRDASKERVSSVHSDNCVYSTDSKPEDIRNISNNTQHSAK
eukprot:m.112829 g.112829  ORF g.112829 m.112829 type:complete len:57 (+) comp17043_c0_seq3:1241-1411(+)